MSAKTACALLGFAAIVVTVQCKPTAQLSLQDDVLIAFKELEKAVDVSIERNLNRLSEARDAFDAVMAGNLKNALKQMRDNVHSSQNRLKQLESEAHVDVSECTEGVGKIISRIPTIPTKDMFLCMDTEEKQVNKIYERGQKDLQQFRLLVEDIENRVLHCENSECLNELLTEIQEQTKQMPTNINVKTIAINKQIDNTQSKMITCSADAIHLVEVRIWSVEYYATKCIEDKVESS